MENMVLENAVYVLKCQTYCVALKWCKVTLAVPLHPRDCCIKQFCARFYTRSDIIWLLSSNVILSQVCSVLQAVHQSFACLFNPSQSFGAGKSWQLQILVWSVQSCVPKLPTGRLAALIYEFEYGMFLLFAVLFISKYSNFCSPCTVRKSLDGENISVIW